MRDEKNVAEEDDRQPTVSVSKKRTANLGDYNSASTQVSIDGIPVDDFDSVEDAEDKVYEILEVANEAVHTDLNKEVGKSAGEQT